MDDTSSGARTPQNLVPSRLLEPQPLRGSNSRPGGFFHFGAVLMACALTGVAVGLLLVRPSRSPLVVAHGGHARPMSGGFPDGTAVPFQGAGAWVDVWDYAPAYQDPGAAPRVRPADVAVMAASGARTLYLQTAGVTHTAGSTEDPGLLGRFLAAAHARGMRVVGWYTPSLTDPGEGLARLVAVARFSAGGELPRISWTPGGTDGADPATLTRGSVARIRALTSDPRAAIHPLGAVGGVVTDSDVRAFVGVAAETGAVGASVYDFRTTPAGSVIEIGTASAGGFGDRELSE
jgi:hypothetical protein